jgi:hypothetical protein
LLVIALLEYSCRSNPQKAADLSSASVETLNTGESGYSSSEMKDELPVNYFSPVEIADLFQKAGVPFSK